MGFFYRDILTRQWESGVDEGIRFEGVATGPLACVDATAHVYWLYEHAARWASQCGEDGGAHAENADRLRSFMQERLFNPATGFFHDIWWADKAEAPLAFEGMWPVVVGAATPEQAARVIDENLMNPDRFLTAHPIATVAKSDPRFELRMWRGPAWNSMTYWAATACARYERRDAANRLIEAALDASAEQFDRTGTIWEFYHPDRGHPEALARKPNTSQNQPCRDYLGHNPLIAMARFLGFGGSW